jgi:hypothetical protein
MAQTGPIATMGSNRNGMPPEAIVDGDTIYVPVKRSTIVSSGEVGVGPNMPWIASGDSTLALSPDAESESALGRNPSSAMSASERGTTGEVTVARSNTVSNRIELA